MASSSNKREWDWCLFFIFCSLSISLSLHNMHQKKAVFSHLFPIFSRAFFYRYYLTRNQTYIFSENHLLSHELTNGALQLGSPMASRGRNAAFLLFLLSVYQYFL